MLVTTPEPTYCGETKRQPAASGDLQGSVPLMVERDRQILGFDLAAMAITVDNGSEFCSRALEAWVIGTNSLF